MNPRIRFYLFIVLLLLLAKHCNDKRMKKIAYLSHSEGCLDIVTSNCYNVKDEYDKQECMNNAIGYCRTRTVYFEIDVEKEGLVKYLRY